MKHWYIIIYILLLLVGARAGMPVQVMVPHHTDSDGSRPGATDKSGSPSYSKYLGPWTGLKRWTVQVTRAPRQRLRQNDINVECIVSSTNTQELQGVRATHRQSGGHRRIDRGWPKQTRRRDRYCVKMNRTILPVILSILLHPAIEEVSYNLYFVWDTTVFIAMLLCV